MPAFHLVQNADIAVWFPATEKNKPTKQSDTETLALALAAALCNYVQLSPCPRSLQ